MKNYSRYLLIVVLGSLIFFPFFSQAIELENPLKADDFTSLITSLINIIATMALVVAPIMLLVAGFYFITAAGNPSQINTAKQIIIWTLIGLVIIFSAWGIINLFVGVFETKEPLNP